MQIGEVIRKYRKELQLTQEEMAGRLGVTAPAVNKWESGASMPDIALLAPIARLLGITPDTLLSFQESPTPEEITAIVREADAKLKKEPYDQVFQWAKKQWERYPNCGALMYQLAVILDAQRIGQALPDSEAYDGELCALYERVLRDGGESMRSHAADALFDFYLRKGQYQKAEEYLSCFSGRDPERKRRQARIFQETGRKQEARKAYEELLFSCYQMASVSLHGLYAMALQEENMEEAHRLADKQGALARCFEMGLYYETSWHLELAAVEKDAGRAVEVMRRMLSGIDEMDAFCRSPLYAHMEWKSLSREFCLEMKEKLLRSFRDPDGFGFLKDDERYRQIIGD